MTKGSWIHDDVARHFNACAKCREVNPEAIRVSQPEARRRTVPGEVLIALCSEGRAIYRAYLRWLAEPAE